MRRTQLVWTAITLILLGAALDFWRWDQPVTLGPWGLPRWSLYFVGLQVALAAAVGLFARRAWDRLSDRDR